MKKRFSLSKGAGVVYHDEEITGYFLGRDE
jgi:hypothetical protein